MDPIQPQPSWQNRKTNNFNLLRLIFASMVLLSHSPELLDGNRSREIGSRLFGTISLGEVGLICFFLLSGYLITQSFLNSKSILTFFRKRILRIYPAFVIAFLFSFFIVGPVVGGHLSQLAPVDFGKIIWKLAALTPPARLPGALSGAAVPELNASMWTISYEFRCYVLAAALGIASAFRPRWLIVGGALAFLAVSSGNFLSDDNTFGFPGSYKYNARFFGIFLVGSSYYLFQDSVIYKRGYVLLAALVLFASLFNAYLATGAVAICGGYIILYLALHSESGAASRMANRVDISYGLYLYAWPVQNSLIHFFPAVSPWTLTAIGLPIAGSFGFLSWHFIERNALKWKSKSAVG